jgi:hypothetical protein
MLYFFSSSHMRSGVVILVSSLEDANTICSRGLSENGRFFEPQYLVGIPKKLRRNMVAVQNLKGEIIQLILSRKGGLCTCGDP